MSGPEAERVLRLRPVAEHDCRLLWEWVNEPTVRAVAFESHAIAWQEHVAWFQRTMQGRGCRIDIVTDGEEHPIGQVRFDLRGDGAEVDVSIAREHRRRGYASEALRLACRALFRTTDTRVVTAHIRPDNVASIRSFEKAGFTHQGRTVVKGVEALTMTLERQAAPPAGVSPAHGSKIRVLVTGAGGSGTIEIIRALKSLGRYDVIGVDASPYAAGFAFCDRGYIVPMGAEPAFGPHLRDIVFAERPDAVVPLVDEEISTVHAIVAALPAPRPLVVAPALSFCLGALDKWETHAMLTRAGIPTPPTCLASRPKDVTYPAVVKPRWGHGSRGVAFLDGPDDLATYLERDGTPEDGFVVQQRVAGREYTVSCVVAVGGPVLGVVPKEIICKRGITQQAVTRVVPVIDRMCHEIQEWLRADGPFNVQLILGENGMPSVIEINPRFSTTVALTIAAGVNEVDLVIRHALGERIGPVRFEPDLLMLRYPAQLYRRASEWPPAAVAVERSDADSRQRLRPRW